MADAADKELRLLLRLIADTGDATKITASLNQIKAQASVVTNELKNAGNAGAAGFELSNRQMTALARALSQGHISIRTMSSLFGQMGSSVTAAGFAGYLLYQ